MQPNQASTEPSNLPAPTNASTVPSNRTPALNTSASTVITPDTLQAPAPMNVPPAPVSTATAGMQGVLESAQGETDTFLQGLTQDRQTAEASKSSSLDQYLSSLMAPGQIQQTAQMYSQKGGVDEIQRELDAVNNKILTEQNALRRKIERIQSSGGGLASGASAEIENLERESLAKQADLYVIQMGVQGRFDSAKTIADRAVAAQLEVQQQRQNVLGLLYQDNKEQFTKAEQREFETKQADRERKIQEEADNKKSMYELAIQAQMDGAPTSVVEQMLASKTKEEALAIGGSYLGMLDRQMKQAQLANIYDQINARQVARNAELVAAAQAAVTEAEKKKVEDEAASEGLLGLQAVLNNLTNAPGFSSAVGFGVKKSGTARTLAGAGTGAAIGAGIGSVVPVVGTAIGGAVGGIGGGIAGFFAGDEALPGSSRADFEILATRLSDMFLVENLGKMSGVLTDKDLEVLRSEGTTIGNFNQSEESWLQERDRLAAMVERGLRQHGVTVEQAAFYNVGNRSEDDIGSASSYYDSL